MNDENNNGIPDSGEVSFHLKSALLGAVLALALGGSMLGLVRAILPNSDTVKAIGTWFAGTACSDIERECQIVSEQKDSAILQMVKSMQYDEKMIVCLTAGRTHDECVAIIGGR